MEIKKIKKDINWISWVIYPQEKIGYLKLKEGKIHHTEVLVEGKIFADKDEDGNILGVEFI